MAIPVRVLLQENSLNDTNWLLESPHGFMCYSPTDKRTQIITQPSIQVRYTKGAFQVNEHILKPESYIIPIQGRITNGSIPYDGICKLSTTAAKAYLVNHLDLEEYITSVLPYESMPSWPDEVQKALCIACRSYAMAKITANPSRNILPYDFKNSVLDQVYKGHEKNVDLSHIIKQTKGMVLSLDNKPILAMYSAVCGGIVPAHKHDSIFLTAPYLKRPYACTHCANHRLYRWRSSHRFKDLEKTLSKEFPGLGSIKDISLSTYDPAGVAHKVIIQGDTSVTMDAHDFRMQFYGRMRSRCCTFETKDGRLYMRGKGHGHHLGLCQWGAYAMVKKGHTYKEVLSYYYPDTTLMTLQSIQLT